MDSSASGSTSSTPWVNQASKDPIDLTHCDREQVQFPGAIMPHGVLLILSPSDLRIQGASANTLTWFGTDVTQLLQSQLDQIVTPANQQLLEQSLALITESQPPHYLGNFTTLQSHHRFDVFAHRSNTVLIVEFEPTSATETESIQTARLIEISDAISKLHKAETWQEGMAIGARELKRLTGFDSVVGARFLNDGSFHAIAEACKADFPSVLDKRFPRSDIPEPGRQQMRLIPVQYAFNLDYDPVPILFADQAQDSLQIDLSFAMLRSISPMCRLFYKNMRVQSRMIMALIDQGELWGFFSCKNATPREVSYADRLAVKLFAEMSALLLIEKERTEQLQIALQIKHSITKITTQLSAAEVFSAALNQVPEQLLNTLDVTGVALYLGQHIISAGSTPKAAVIQSLILWLDTQNESLFTSDRLPTLFETTAQSLAPLATGLLAAHLKRPGQYLLCFRPEVVQEVNWAGDPDKQAKIDPISGEKRFTPRGSFEVWKQDMRGLARPWQAYETEAISDLQLTIIRLQYAEKQRILQTRLVQSNTELEAFAYIVSHDLQEPLRGISHFTQLLMQSNTEQLGPQEHKWFNTILNLSGRMSDQINALLQYSRASQEAMAVQAVDLNLLLSKVLEGLSTTIKHTNTQIKIPSTLPTVNCDPIRVASVLSNLITNAIKYNDQAEKHVEIGYQESPNLVFFVKDNGIGIPERFYGSIFDIFRRLHGRNEYSGGTGAGLSIVRKHIERHGGRLWLESTLGQGTTFYFTLGSDLALTVDSKEKAHD